jgi:hypothetical protein
MYIDADRACDLLDDGQALLKAAACSAGNEKLREALRERAPIPPTIVTLELSLSDVPEIISSAH